MLVSAGLSRGCSAQALGAGSSIGEKAAGARAAPTVSQLGVDMIAIRQKSAAKVVAAVAAVGGAAIVGVLGAGLGAQSQSPPNTAMVPLTRDLTKELANKMKGTYVVAAVGDLLMQEPMGKMISPDLQRILRTRIPPSATKKTMSSIPRTGTGPRKQLGPERTSPRPGRSRLRLAGAWRRRRRRRGMNPAANWYDKVGIQIAGQGPNLTTARTPVFKQTPERPRGSGQRVSRARPRRRRQRATRRKPQWQQRPGPVGSQSARMTVWNVVSPEMLQQFKAMKDAIMARRLGAGRGATDVARPGPARSRHALCGPAVSWRATRSVRITTR